MEENAKKIIEDSLKNGNDVVIVDAKANLETLEKTLSNDPKGCLEDNKKILDLVKDLCNKVS